jgi:Ion channel
MTTYLELSAGLLLLAVVLYDVFETVVVPRRTEYKWRLAPPLIFFLWPVWRVIGLRMQPAWRRENFLGTFAPFVIMLLLVVWVLSLVLGFGLVLHALADDFEPQPKDFMSAVYVAGSALLTIGFGDIVPTGVLARIAALLAGAAGLGVVALVITLTFNLYGSFARREVMVLLLDGRAGTPPSGVTLLETYARKRIVGQLAEAFARYEVWTAEVLESHLAYPILPFFRSSHDGQSWISALGAVLDAATLLVTVVEKPGRDAAPEENATRAAAEMMYDIGCHALVDLTEFRLMQRHLAFDDRPGIERAEFEEACRQLSRAGFRTVCGDEAWQAFAEHRSVYAARLNGLARYLASPPTQWIGDRTILERHHKPHY